MPTKAEANEDLPSLAPRQFRKHANGGVTRGPEPNAASRGNAIAPAPSAPGCGKRPSWSRRDDGRLTRLVLNQGFENSGYVTDDFLEAVAEGAGVPDIAKWNEDRDNADWDAALEATDADAAEHGLTGTPSILVTGPGDTVGFDSNPTLDQIEAAIRDVQ